MGLGWVGELVGVEVEGGERGVVVVGCGGLWWVVVGWGIEVWEERVVVEG